MYPLILIPIILSCEPVGEPIEWIDPCPGHVTCGLPDLDSDGAVGIVDLLYVLTHWGETNCLDHWRADINKDREIGVTDFFIVLDAWAANYQPGTWDRCDCE